MFPGVPDQAHQFQALAVHQFSQAAGEGRRKLLQALEAFHQSVPLHKEGGGSPGSIVGDTAFGRQDGCPFDNLDVEPSFSSQPSGLFQHAPAAILQSGGNRISDPEGLQVPVPIHGK